MKECVLFAAVVCDWELKFDAYLGIITWDCALRNGYINRFEMY